MASRFVESVGVRVSASRLRVRLCLGTALALSASILADPALAACSTTTPANGQTVDCTGASTTGVIADTATGVTVNVAAGATVIPPAGQAINLGSGAQINVAAGSTVGNNALDNTYAVRIGNGATVTVDGKIQGRGGITGPGTDPVTNFDGFSNALIIVRQGGEIVTSGTGYNAALNGRGGGNTFRVDGTISDIGSTQGIMVGTGDTVTLGATGKIISTTGNSGDPIYGSGVANVTVTTAAGSLIELHGLGEGMWLGRNANVTLGGLIRSYGDAYSNANSSGGKGVWVLGNSTVRLLQGGQIITGNTQGLSNQGTGGIGISTFESNVASRSTITVDGLIDTQRAYGIFGGLDDITVGATGRITARGTTSLTKAIFLNAYSTAAQHTINVDIAGTVEQLGTAHALFIQGTKVNTEATETAIVANITIREGGTLFAQANAAYGELDGNGASYPEIAANIVIAGTVARGTPGTVLDLNDGADRVTFMPTYALVGNVNGGSDAGGPSNPTETDTFALDGGVGTSATFNFGANQISNFEAGEKLGAGTWTLAGTTAGLNGLFSVNAGKLIVDGTLSNTSVQVASGATLGGSGAFGGAGTIAGGGILQGTAGADLGFGSLVLNDTSLVQVALGAPSNTALFAVAGALTLDGRLAVTNAGGFGYGTYRLIDYGGVLTDHGLVIQSLPNGFNPGGWGIDVGTAGQVSLIVAQGSGDQYWDGSNMTPGGVANGRGGTGTWNAANTNWTNQAGTINAPWAGQNAVFAAAGASTVTVAGTQAFTGLQFLNGASYNFVAGAEGKFAIGGSTPVVLDQSGGSSTAVSIAVPITGDGGIVKDGGGTLTLAGANSYTGGTTVLAGVLDVGSDGALGGAGGGVMLDGGTLRTSAAMSSGRGIVIGPGGGTLATGANAVTLSGTLAGSGALQRSGSSTLTYSGSGSAYAGTFTLGGGTLALTGSLGGTLRIGNGARLAGSGTLRDLVVESGGVVAPGASVGTLTSAGNLTFNAGSFFDLDIAASGAGDKLVTSGTATLNGGTVRIATVDPENAYIDGSRYTFLTAAGGVSGTFAGLTETSAFLDFTLGYTGTSAFVDLALVNVFPDVATTFNQTEVAAPLADFPLTPQSDTRDVFLALAMLDANGAQNAFDLSSGEIYAAALGGAVSQAAADARQLFGQAQAPAGEGWSLWGAFDGQDGRVSGDGNGARYTHDRIGGTLGFGYHAPGNRFAAGLGAGYWAGNVDLPARASQADTEGWRLGGYVRAGTGGVGMSATLVGGYASGDARVERRIAFGPLARTATAHADLDSWTLAGEGRFGFALGKEWAAGPIARITYSEGSLGRFAESGAASLDLAGGSGSGDHRTLFGGGLFAKWSGERGGIDLTALYVRGDDDPAEVVLALSGLTNVPFRVRAARSGKSHADLGVAGHYRIAPSVSLGLAVNAALSDRETSASVRAEIGWSF